MKRWLAFASAKFAVKLIIRAFSVATKPSTLGQKISLATIGIKQTQLNTKH